MQLVQEALPKSPIKPIYQLSKQHGISTTYRIQRCSLQNNDFPTLSNYKNDHICRSQYRSRTHQS